MLMEGVSVQFYIDRVAGNLQILKITSGEVITGFALVIRGIIDRDTRDDAICGQHIRDIHALNHGPGMGGVDAVAIIVTATHFRICLLKRNEAIDFLAGNTLRPVTSVASQNNGRLRY